MTKNVLKEKIERYLEYQNNIITIFDEYSNVADEIDAFDADNDKVDILRREIVNSNFDSIYSKINKYCTSQYTNVFEAKSLLKEIIDYLKNNRCDMLYNQNLTPNQKYLEILEISFDKKCDVLVELYEKLSSIYNKIDKKEDINYSATYDEVKKYLQVDAIADLSKNATAILNDEKSRVSNKYDEFCNSNKENKKNKLFNRNYIFVQKIIKEHEKYDNSDEISPLLQYNIPYGKNTYKDLFGNASYDNEDDYLKCLNKNDLKDYEDDEFKQDLVGFVNYRDRLVDIQKNSSKLISVYSALDKAIDYLGTEYKNAVSNMFKTKEEFLEPLNKLIKCNFESEGKAISQELHDLFSDKSSDTCILDEELNNEHRKSSMDKIFKKELEIIPENLKYLDTLEEAEVDTAVGMVVVNAETCINTFKMFEDVQPQFNVKSNPIFKLVANSKIIKKIAIGTGIACVCLFLIMYGMLMTPQPIKSIYLITLFATFACTAAYLGCTYKYKKDVEQSEIDHKNYLHTFYEEKFDYTNTMNLFKGYYNELNARIDSLIYQIDENVKKFNEKCEKYYRLANSIRLTAESCEDDAFSYYRRNKNGEINPYLKDLLVYSSHYYYKELLDIEDGDELDKFIDNAKANRSEYYAIQEENARIEREERQREEEEYQRICQEKALREHERRLEMAAQEQAAQMKRMADEQAKMVQMEQQKRKEIHEKSIVQCMKCRNNVFCRFKKDLMGDCPRFESK